jgi:thiamine biosynthesis lipoprotein
MKPLLLIMSLLLVVTGCSPTEQQLYKTRILSFGTFVDVTLADIEPELAEAAIDDIETELDYMHAQWHAWRPSSITELNAQLQSGVSFKIKPELLPLIQQSRQLYNQSLGHFNPAIGKLIELWGFYSDDPQSSKQIPDPEAIQELVRSGPHMNDILIHGELVKGVNEDLQIDFGAYAKGFGVEQLIEQLKAQGIHNALISAGGDLKGIGTNHGKPWRIAIQDPFSKSPLGWLALESGETIFTSGSYERYFEYQGKHYHHIIDPNTGYPSEHAKAVTVIGHDAAISDAAATALMIAPQQEWAIIMQNMGINHLLVVASDGKLYADPALIERINLIAEKIIHPILPIDS